eukprot:580548-Pleurochrysis_carterae.AAC.2
MFTGGLLVSNADVVLAGGQADALGVLLNIAWDIIVARRSFLDAPPDRRLDEPDWRLGAVDAECVRVARARVMIPCGGHRGRDPNTRRRWRWWRGGGAGGRLGIVQKGSAQHKESAVHRRNHDVAGREKRVRAPGAEVVEAVTIR